MFFESFTKCFSRLTNIFFFTLHLTILLPLDHATFLEDYVFVLWGNQEVSESCASFKMNLYVMFAADVFQPSLSLLAYGITMFVFLLIFTE